MPSYVVRSDTLHYSNQALEKNVTKLDEGRKSRSVFTCNASANYFFETSYIAYISEAPENFRRLSEREKGEGD